MLDFCIEVCLSWLEENKTTTLDAQAFLRFCLDRFSGFFFVVVVVFFPHVLKRKDTFSVAVIVCSTSCRDFSENLGLSYPTESGL